MSESSRRFLLLVCLLVPALLAAPARAATFTVTTMNDDNSAGTLRWAMEQANTNNDKDTIVFNIVPGGTLATIQPTNWLPDITQPVIIDGTTQSGSACTPGIELNGSLAAGLVGGLFINNTSNCEIRGLVINNFGQDGITLQLGRGHKIYGNYIGTDASGTADAGNALDGILVNGSANNDIGLTPLSCTNRNIISGNGQHGIEVVSLAATGNRINNNYIGTDVTGLSRIQNDGDGVNVAYGGSTEIGNTGGRKPVNLISGNASNGVSIGPELASLNTVQGNYIGTTVAGSAALGNGTDGVFIQNCGGNQVGFTTSEGMNVISANGDDGVEITGTNAQGNYIRSNYIGTDAQGLFGLGNEDDGVVLSDGTSQDQVGGLSSGERNVISGNKGCGMTLELGAHGNFIYGNYIGLDEAGMMAVTNSEHGIQLNQGAYGNVIGMFLTNGCNVISGNDMDGLHFDNGNDNDVSGNLIGLNVANFAVTNKGDGIRILNSGTNRIGGLVLWQGNVISGNGGDGVQLGTNAFDNEICGNLIGLNTNGLSAVPNGGDGVNILRSSDNRIGLSTAPFNVISGNRGNGVAITDGPASTRNTLENNRIGTDRLGALAVPNGLDGVYVGGAFSNTVGTVAAGNLISGNGQHGVRLGLGAFAATENVIQNNLIGVNALALAAIPNGACGVYMLGARGNVVGGTNVLGNVISGNANRGVWIQGGFGNRVIGNRIGTDGAVANPIPNGSDGVHISGGGSYNMVGDNRAAAANAIAYNGSNGVSVASGTNNAVYRNAIYSNGFLGIDVALSGVSPNDDKDLDGGGNFGQNYPALSSATTGSLGDLLITGVFNSSPTNWYRLDFFLNDAPDASGYGEGKSFLGATNFTTDNDGNWSFASMSLAGGGATTGLWIAATATDTNFNTSEFSICVRIVPNDDFDADGDGMPTSWERTWGLDPYDPTGTNGAAGDPDVDYVDNYDEYVADTDPDDASNYLHFTSIAEPSNTVVTHTSTNTRYYVVDFTTNIVEEGGWTDLYTPPVQGSNSLTSAADTNAALFRLYRVNVQLTP